MTNLNKLQVYDVYTRISNVVCCDLPDVGLYKPVFQAITSLKLPGVVIYDMSYKFKT